jgi:hypothetical protein
LRGWFLFRRRADRGKDGERAEVGCELDGGEAVVGARPELGCEIEETVTGPVRQDAQQVAQVDVGVEGMEPSGGDEREEVTGGLGVVVGADEQPCVSADSDGLSARSDPLFVGARRPSSR